MTNNIFIACCIIAAELFAAAQCQAGCNHLFHHKAVVVQQVVQPQVYYFAGQATQDEALLRKAIRAELQGVIQQLQQQHAPPIQPLVNPATATGSVFSAKCLRCHSGEAAKGSLRLDDFIDAATRWRITEILSGHLVPDAMKGVVNSLQPGDHPAILQELMNQRPAPAKPPESQPMPADPFDQQPGVLR